MEVKERQNKERGKRIHLVFSKGLENREQDIQTMVILPNNSPGERICRHALRESAPFVTNEA